MRNLYAAMLLTLTACQGVPTQAPTGSTNTTAEGTGVAQAATAPATLDLTGRWRKVGTFCGPTYTPLTYVEYTDFSATEMSVSMQVTCAGAIIPVQYYELRYEVSAISVRLDRGFASCPSNYNSSPTSTFQTKAVRITVPGQAFEMTEGTCNSSQHWNTISAYQKQ